MVPVSQHLPLACPKNEYLRMKSPQAIQIPYTDVVPTWL